MGRRDEHKLHRLKARAHQTACVTGFSAGAVALDIAVRPDGKCLVVPAGVVSDGHAFPDGRSIRRTSLRCRGLWCERHEYFQTVDALVVTTSCSTAVFSLRPVCSYTPFKVFNLVFQNLKSPLTQVSNFVAFDLNHDLSFSNFVLRLHERKPVSDGKVLPLGARGFDVLPVLAQRSGDLVTKAEMFEQVWPGGGG